MVLSNPKIAINLPRTFEKLHCKGKPHRFRTVSEILRYRQKDRDSFTLLLQGLRQNYRVVMVHN